MDGLHSGVVPRDELEVAAVLGGFANEDAEGDELCHSSQPCVCQAWALPRTLTCSQELCLSLSQESRADPLECL